MTDWRRLLHTCAPYAHADIVSMVADYADTQFSRFHLTSPERQAHLLGQMAVETQGFTKIEEGLNYSAGRLRQVWPKRFRTEADAEKYAHNPKALAIKVYGGRMGNRLNTDDGWVFRGKGGLQTTGRENTEKLAEKLGVDAATAADWLTDPEHMLECACANFVVLGCLAYADQVNPATILSITTHVNGGTNGLSERENATNAFYKALKPKTTALGFMSTDEQTPASESTLPASDMKQVQSRLSGLGYFPGKIDGKAAAETNGALAAFKTDHGLPADAVLDQETLDALGSTLARPRPIPLSRSHATIDDLRDQGSETIKAADDAQSNLSVTAVGATVGVGVVSETIGKFSALRDAIGQLPDLVQFALSHALLIAVVFAGCVAWYERTKIVKALDRIRKARLRDHRTFKHRGR